MLDENSTYVATLQPWTQYFPENQLLVDLGMNPYQNPTPARTLGTYKILGDRSQSSIFLLHLLQSKPLSYFILLVQATYKP